MRVRFCVGALALSLAASVHATAQTIEYTAREASSVARFVKDQPYSGEGVTTVRQTLADGTRIERRITARFFRDSSGRIRREQTIIGLNEVDPSAYDLTSLRMITTGGEPTPLAVIRGVHERFPGVAFVNTYGTTESGPITTLLPPEDSLRKIGSVGRAAFGVQVRIADADGRALPPN